MFRLARELRYRPLSIIGQRLVIETLAEVEPALARLAQPWAPGPRAWDGCQITAGLAKYGLLDRWCGVGHELLDDAATLGGVRALRANGFSRRDPDPDPEAEAELRALEVEFCAFEADCMVDLANSLGPCHLKLFLHDDLSHEVRFHHRKRAQTGPREVLPGYFPRAFTVTDACVSNASLIWLGKHFYL
jgi:hypothetical protein